MSRWKQVDHPKQSATQRVRRSMALLALVPAALVALSLGAGCSGWQMMDGHMGDGHMGRGRGGTGASSPPLADAGELTVEAGDLFFRPAELEISAGRPVNVVLTNGGSLFHDFTVDEVDFQLSANRGDSATGGLQIDQPGEYRYYCSVPGHASAGMSGTLTVVAPSA